MEVSAEDFRNLLDRIRELRNETYLRMGFEVSTSPGPPATPDEVNQVEATARRLLPLDYRQFLLHHNGWHYWSGDVALLSTGEMFAGPYSERIAEWKSQEEKRGNTEVLRSLVIGCSLFAGEKVLLVPNDDQFSWHVVVWDNGPADKFPDFVHYLLNHKGILEEEILEMGRE